MQEKGSVVLAVHATSVIIAERETCTSENDLLVQDLIEKPSMKLSLQRVTMTSKI